MDGGVAGARRRRFPADPRQAPEPGSSLPHRGSAERVRSPASWRLRLDDVQARHAWLAVAFGWSRKRQDDQATYLGALVGHYLFMSTLPLLVSFTWILGRATAHDPSLRRRVTDGLAGQVPVLGDQLRHGTLHGSAAGLAVLLVFAVLAGLAVLVVAQDASATVWGVPKAERAGGLAARARSLIIVVALGLLLVAWALVAGVVVTVSAAPVVGRALGLGVCVGALTLVVAGLFAALSPGQREHWWQHWPGALATAVGCEADRRAASLATAAALPAFSGCGGRR